MITSLRRPQTTTSPLGEVALVAGVEPAVGVLRRDRAVDGQVAGRHRVAAQLEHPDLALAEHGTVVADDPDLDPRQRRARAAGTAAPDRRRPAPRAGAPPAASASISSTCRPVSIGANDTPSAVSAIPYAHTTASGRSPNRAPGRGERGDGGRVDRLGAVEREPQRRQVERPVVGAGELAGEHGVGEVRRRGHRAAVARDQLGPQQRAAEEVGRGDAHQLDARRPSARSGTRPSPCRGTAAATTPSRRGRRRAWPPATIAAMLACRLRWVIRTALGSAVEPLVSCSSAVSSSPAASAVGVDGLAVEVRRAVRNGMPRSASTGASASNGRPEQHEPGVDHREHRRRCPRPGGEVGPRGGLVQHRHAAAEEPDGLRGRGDRGRLAGQHADGRASPDARPPRSAPAARRAVSWTSGHDRRTGVRGSPVVMPCGERAPVASSIARNRDMAGEPTTPEASPRCARPCDPRARAA